MWIPQNLISTRNKLVTGPCREDLCSIHRGRAMCAPDLLEEDTACLLEEPGSTRPGTWPLLLVLGLAQAPRPRWPAPQTLRKNNNSSLGGWTGT